MSRSLGWIPLIALATLVFAPAAGDAAASRPSRIEALTQQVRLRYQHHAPSFDSRMKAIDAVLAEWERVGSAAPGADQTTDPEAQSRNRQRLDAWIARAMRSLLPGGSGRLPKPPRFESPLASLAPRAIGPVSAPAEPIPQKPAEFPTTPLEETPPLAKSQGPITSRSAPRTPPRDRLRPAEQSAEPPTERSIRQRVAKPVTPTEPKPTASKPTELKGTESPTERSKWSRHPAAAPLEWSDPFEDEDDDPLGSGATRRGALRPVFDEGSPVGVNLAQLAAEVRGYSGAVRELQTEVMALDDDDLVGLIQAADRLEQLLAKRRFLDLYREGLPADDRRALPGAPSAELIRELVRRKAESLLRQTPPERQAERGALKRLAERLAPTPAANSSTY